MIRNFWLGAILLAALTAAAHAAPLVTLDVVRNGAGNPVLSSAGNFQYVLSVIPDTSLFNNPADTPDKGLGGSTAIDLLLAFTGRPIVAAATKNATNFDTDIPGLGTASWLTLTDVDPSAAVNMRPVGLQTNLAEGHVYAALGSIFFTSGGPKSAIFALTAGPKQGALTTSAVWAGSVYQAGAGFATAGLFSYTAKLGDVNLDGVVDELDRDIVLGNLGAGNQHWGTGDITGDGFVNAEDLRIVASAVPEPAGLVLAAVAAGAIACVHRRRR